MTPEISPSMRYPPISITVNRTTPLQVFDISSDEDFEVDVKSKCKWSYVNTDKETIPLLDTQLSDGCTDPEALTPTPSRRSIRHNLIVIFASAVAGLAMISLVVMSYQVTGKLQDLGDKDTFQPLILLAGMAFGLIFMLWWMLLCYHTEEAGPMTRPRNHGEESVSFLVSFFLVFIMTQVVWNLMF